MNILKQVVGIDMSMDKFNASFGTLSLTDTKELKKSYPKAAVFSNSFQDHEKFLQWALDQRVSSEVQIIFVIEATGVYYENLAYFLAQKNQKIAVVLPNKTKNFANTLEQKSKTDKLDARMLAQFGLEKELPCWKIPAEIMRKLKILTREYHSTKELAVQIKNRLHAHMHSYQPLDEVTKIIKQQISFFETQLKILEKKILKLVQKDKDLYDKINKIDKIEGVGPMTIITILAETDCFSLVLNYKQLTSYSGLDVLYNQSGINQGKTTISKKGNSHIRTALYMPALTAARRSPKLKALYIRLLERGKSKKAALIAVARKLLILIYTIWKKNVEYISGTNPVLVAAN